MIQYCVLGNGGHGRMLGELMADQHLAVEVCRHDVEPQDGQIIVIGLGNAAKTGDSGLHARAELYKKYQQRVTGVRVKTAIICGTVDYTAQILHGVILQPNSYVGPNVIVNTGAVVEHDCYISASSHIGPRAVLCGNVTVGELTHIGAGAVVKQGVRIGSGCVIGAGAVVIGDVADGMTVVGNPAMGVL